MSDEKAPTRESRAMNLKLDITRTKKGVKILVLGQSSETVFDRELLSGGGRSMKHAARWLVFNANKLAVEIEQLVHEIGLLTEEEIEVVGNGDEAPE